MTALPHRLLRVDLSAGTVESEVIPATWRRRYIGGKGLGARYLYEELEAGVDPLGPSNRLLFLVGPLTGRLPGDPRYAAVTKSPLTGTFLDSYAGGTFPARLAGALGDHLGVLVQGAAAEPVRIEVAGGTATVEPAETWGADTPSVDEAYPEAAVACIGPAGERAVSYATIASDGGDHHAGRGGAGAVMGAKRLKALVARGDAPSDLGPLRERATERFRDDETGRWQASSETVESVDFADEVGALATRGWTEGRFEGATDVGVEAVKAAATGRERENDAVPGGFRVETAAGESVPRGATAMSLGAGLGIDDFDRVAELGTRCNRLGLDLISAGSAVAWAIRAAEAGYLERDLEFGDAAAVDGLLGEIVERRTPLGEALAAGVDAAADRYGGHDLVPTVKAMSLPAYDPRRAASMALAYATSDRGACHRRARPIEREPFEGPWTPKEAATHVIAAQNERSVLWSLIVDDFAGDTLEDSGAAWLSAIGLESPAAELPKVGERIWTLTRLFNVREGFDRADDNLPPVLTEPIAGGPADGSAIDRDTFAAMRTAYYAARGWGRDGRPLSETVRRLGLATVVDEETPLGEPPETKAATAEADDAAPPRRG